MAAIVITIDTDGAAFIENAKDPLLPPDLVARREVARILHIMANEFGSHGTLTHQKDANGKTVGTAEIWTTGGDS